MVPHEGNPELEVRKRRALQASGTAWSWELSCCPSSSPSDSESPWGALGRVHGGHEPQRTLLPSSQSFCSFPVGWTSPSSPTQVFFRGISLPNYLAFGTVVHLAIPSPAKPLDPDSVSWHVKVTLENWEHLEQLTVVVVTPGVPALCRLPYVHVACIHSFVFSCSQ